VSTKIGPFGLTFSVQILHPNCNAGAYTKINKVKLDFLSPTLNCKYKLKSHTGYAVELWLGLPSTGPDSNQSPDIQLEEYNLPSILCCIKKLKGQQKKIKRH
jgi:hypothetical protein